MHSNLQFIEDKPIFNINSTIIELNLTLNDITQNLQIFGCTFYYYTVFIIVLFTNKIFVNIPSKFTI